MGSFWKPRNVSWKKKKEHFFPSPMAFSSSLFHHFFPSQQIPFSPFLPYFLFFRIFANKPFGKYGKWNEEEEEPTSHNTLPDEKPSSDGGGWKRREGNNLFSTAWLFWEEEVARAGAPFSLQWFPLPPFFFFPLL